jgi:thiol-disulfide isomerase/thioredoxin
VRRSVVLAIAAGLLLAACAERTAPGSGGLGGSPSSGLLPKNRLDLPSFDLEKYQALLTELRGTPVVVNIWGSWCPPCRVEAPGLSKVAREFEGKVQFLGVDMLDVRESAREFILEYDWPYPSVFDEDAEIRDRLGYVGQPITIIHDRDGNVTFEWVGVITEDLLRKEIRQVL